MTLHICFIETIFSFQWSTSLSRWQLNLYYRTIIWLSTTNLNHFLNQFSVTCWSHSTTYIS